MGNVVGKKVEIKEVLEKEEKIRFSIIICGLNVEEYIEKAIQSVLEQEYQNYEIILVNDGSVDNTLQVMKKYESDYVIVINNEKNLGPGGSKNVAVEKARGEFIIYLDGDDTMYDKTTLTSINEIITRDNPDISFFGVQYIGGDNKMYLSNAENSTKEARLSCDIFFGVPSKCWKTEFLRKNNIIFIEDIYYEDMIYSMKATILAETLSYGNFPIFNYYRNRPGSIMSTPNLKRCTDMYKMLAYMMDLYGQTPEEYQKYVLSFIINETNSLPMRIGAIINAIKENKMSPVLPKRNYQFIDELK